jgi:peptide-methionine (S)-S-oxide reductase
VFWHNIDPTQANGQFCDRGSSYRSGIYTHGATQQAAAIKSRDTLAKSAGLPGPIVTEIEPASTFYVAEDYHQDSYKTNPSHYRRYRAGCGRDARLKALWGDKAGR